MDERSERFRGLYRWAQPLVTAYALRRTATPEDAGDVVAETFLVAWRRLDDVPVGDDALLWLYVTARNVLMNEARRIRRRSELVIRMATALTVHGATANAPDEDGLVALQCLRSLPEADREVLMLAAWEGLGAEDIGRVVGCSAAAARVRLHRARRQLRRVAGALAEIGEPTRKHSSGSGHVPPASPAIRCMPEEA